MTVAELIKALEECPQEAEVKVHFYGEEFGQTPVDLVRVHDGTLMQEAFVELLK